VNGLLGALQFLTRVPIRTSHAVPHHRIVAWFPVAGLLIGATVGGVAAGLNEVVPAAVAGAGAVIAGLLITGAFHEDGLGDVADAFGGGWTREQRLEILKDSRHGTYGVAALVSSILVRVAAVGSITSTAAVFAALVAAHVLARTAIVGALLAIRPTIDSGLGADVARSMSRRASAAALLAGAVITVGAVGWWAGPLIGAAIVGTAAVGWLAVRKIGGLAGDVLGAIEQVVECLALVVASGLAAEWAVWWS